MTQHMANHERQIQNIDLGEKKSFTRAGLDNALREDIYSPSGLVGFFERKHAAEFAADAGVWEGYTLRQHTIMVLSQFEKYFSDKPLPGNMDKDFFRVILALHDIGKPEAIQNEGKHFQHKYTTPKMTATLDELGYSEKEKKIAIAIMNGDSLGRANKTGEIEKNAASILGAAQEAETDAGEFFDLVSIYYKCDAGSYTKDAEGKESLDHLFEFDHEQKQLRFAPAINETMQALRTTVINLQNPPEVLEGSKINL